MLKVGPKRPIWDLVWDIWIITQYVFDQVFTDYVFMRLVLLLQSIWAVLIFTYGQWHFSPSHFAQTEGMSLLIYLSTYSWSSLIVLSLAGTYYLSFCSDWGLIPYMHPILQKGLPWNQTHVSKYTWHVAMKQAAKTPVQHMHVWFWPTSKYTTLLGVFPVVLYYRYRCCWITTTILLLPLLYWVCLVPGWEM